MGTPTVFAQRQCHLSGLVCGISVLAVAYVLSIGPVLFAIAGIGSDLQCSLLHGAIWMYAPVAEIVSRSPDCVESLFFDYLAVWGLSSNEAAFFYLPASGLIR